MRAPRPTLPGDAEALGVVADALDNSVNARDHWLLQQQRAAAAEWTDEVTAARRGNFRPLANLLEYRPQLLGRQARGLIAAQLRSKLQAQRPRPRRPGRPPRNQHGLNWHVARELRFIQVLLRARYPHGPITQDWVIRLACLYYELDETNFRNFHRGPHRPRARP